MHCMMVNRFYNQIRAHFNRDAEQFLLKNQMRFLAELRFFEKASRCSTECSIEVFDSRRLALQLDRVPAGEVSRSFLVEETL